MARKARPMGHCARCSRACWKDADDFRSWNGTVDKGVLVALICPQCQSPEEHTEAEVGEAVLDYANAVPDAQGRPIVPLRLDQSTDHTH